MTSWCGPEINRGGSALRFLPSDRKYSLRVGSGVEGRLAVIMTQVKVQFGLSEQLKGEGEDSASSTVYKPVFSMINGKIRLITETHRGRNRKQSCYFKIKA